MPGCLAPVRLRCAPALPATSDAAAKAMSGAARILTSHPVDRPSLVVGDEHRAVPVHQHIDRPPPALARRILPSYDKILDAGGFAVLDADPHDLGPRGHVTIPRSVEGDQGVTMILGGEQRGLREKRD